MLWAVSSVGGTFWAVSRVGGTFLAVLRVGGTVLAVSRVGGTFLAGAVKPNYGGIFSAVMPYGGRRFFFFRR